MTVMSPRPPIGWRPDHTATSDPRVQVECGWCWGSRVVLEKLELGAYYEHIPVVCPGCDGAGRVTKGVSR